MSFRPTIAVFANGRIADVGYYRNWSEKALFFEALTIALLYSDCGSVEEFRERKYGTQNVFYELSPEVIENTDEELAFLLSCSEFPIAVDLSAGCIYVSETPLSEEELEKLEVLEGSPCAKSMRGVDGQTDYYKLLRNHRIPFRGLDRENTLELLRGWDDAERRLSCGTYKELMRAGEGGA